MRRFSVNRVASGSTIKRGIDWGSGSRPEANAAIPLPARLAMGY